MNNDTTWLASFDIGKRNFSFYIEKFNIDDFKEAKIKFEKMR